MKGMKGSGIKSGSTGGGGSKPGAHVKSVEGMSVKSVSSKNEVKFPSGKVSTSVSGK